MGTFGQSYIIRPVKLYCKTFYSKFSYLTFKYVKPAPLKDVPALDEPLSKAIIDCVGRCKDKIWEQLFFQGFFFFKLFI